MADSTGPWDVPEDPGAEEIHLLHVDDDADFTELAAIYLEREDEPLEVVEAHDAEAALEHLRAHRVDCIVSDYQMPGLDGLAFFEALPDEHAETPFILFTGKGSEEVASEAFALGITDYLQKQPGTDQYAVLANRIRQAVANARADERLERARRRFRTLVEEANDAILVVGPDGDITFATPATEHLLGWAPADLVGTNGFDLIHPEDLGTTSEEFARLFDDPDYRGQADFRYERADGSWVWVEARGRNLLANDDIGGIVVYVRDIDGRKAHEAELERSERQFRAVFEEAFDAMLIADDDGTYVDANAAASELFGLEHDELVGRHIREFAPEDHDFEAAWAEFQASERERGLFPLVRPDGEPRTVEFAATHDVLPHRHLSILRDVTDREQLSAG